MVVIVGVLVIVVVRRRQRPTGQSPPLPDLNAGINENDPPSYCEPYVVYEPSPTSDVEPDVDSPGEVTQQYRMCYIDPLTGNRLDGGLVSEAELPYKVCPSLPPPYAERPPPSFDDSIAAEQRQVCEAEASVTAAVNEAFTGDEDDGTAAHDGSSLSSSATGTTADEATACFTRL